MSEAQLREDKKTIYKGGFDIDREILAGNKTTISFYDGKRLKDADHGFKLSYKSDQFNNAVSAIFSEPKNKAMFIKAGLDEKYVDSLFKFFNTERKTAWGFAKSQFGSTNIEYTATGLTPNETRELAKKEMIMEIANAFRNTPKFDDLALKMYDAGKHATKRYNAEVEVYKEYEILMRQKPYSGYDQALRAKTLAEIKTQLMLRGPVVASERAQEDLMLTYKESLNRPDFQQVLKDNKVDVSKRDEASIKKALDLLIKELPNLYSEPIYWQASSHLAAALAEKKKPETALAKAVPTLQVKKGGIKYSEETKDFQRVYNWLIDQKHVKGELLVLDGKRGRKTIAAEKQVEKFLKVKGLSTKQLAAAVRKWNDQQGGPAIETAVAKTEEKKGGSPFTGKLSFYNEGKIVNVPLDRVYAERKKEFDELNEQRISEMLGSIRMAIKDGKQQKAEKLVLQFKDYVRDLDTKDKNRIVAQKLLKEVGEKYYAAFPDQKKGIMIAKSPEKKEAKPVDNVIEKNLIKEKTAKDKKKKEYKEDDF